MAKKPANDKLLSQIEESTESIDKSIEQSNTTAVAATKKKKVRRQKGPYKFDGEVADLLERASYALRTPEYQLIEMSLKKVLTGNYPPIPKKPIDLGDL